MMFLLHLIVNSGKLRLALWNEVCGKRVYWIKTTDGENENIGVFMSETPASL